MCGIAGIFDADLAPAEYANRLQAMADAIRHRGPDQDGYLAAPELGAGLASRRLSLVDLEGGRQPIANEDETIHVVLDGEIYNHVELREKLTSRGHRFRTRCDTETIVHLYEDLGVDCLVELEGMFALAVLDRRRGRLLLARDGTGMKRLYVARTARGVVFASEVKAMLASGLLEAKPDWRSIAAYLAVGYLPAPYSGFEGIEKLRAGTWLILTPGGGEHGTFWIPRFGGPPPASEHDAAAEFEALLSASTKSHLAADVEVGALLSGGLDSSLVAAYAAEQSSKQLKTFSIVFPDDPDVDESRYARAMAKHLGSEHHEIEFRAPEMVELLPEVTRSLEEPHARGPSVVRYQVARLAATTVKAVISGEGADELFAGYRWLANPLVDRAEALRSVFPRSVARRLATLSGRDRWRLFFDVLGADQRAGVDVIWLEHLARGRDGIVRPELRASRSELTALLPHPETLASCRDRLERRLALEMVGRLGDGVLLVGDKTSMAHSLEVRMPFLHRPLVDFALRLPADLKIRAGREKYLLSRIASRLPDSPTKSVPARRRGSPIRRNEERTRACVDSSPSSCSNRATWRRSSIERVSSAAFEMRSRAMTGVCRESGRSPFSSAGGTSFSPSKRPWSRACAGVPVLGEELRKQRPHALARA